MSASAIRHMTNMTRNIVITVLSNIFSQFMHISPFIYTFPIDAPEAGCNRAQRAAQG